MTPEQRQVLMDIMCTAFEGGGSDYWAEARNVRRTEGGNYEYFELRDREDETAEWHPVSVTRLDEAIKKLLHGTVKIRRDLAAQFVGYPDNCESLAPDADAADCAVQVACFGEIVFG